MNRSGFPQIQKDRRESQKPAGISAAPKSVGLFESVGGSMNRSGFPQIQKDRRESQKASRDFSGSEICGPL